MTDTDWDSRFTIVRSPSGNTVWETNEVPTETDLNHWWTLIDVDGELYVVAGRSYVNRLSGQTSPSRSQCGPFLCAKGHGILAGGPRVVVCNKRRYKLA